MIDAPALRSLRFALPVALLALVPVIGQQPAAQPTHPVRPAGPDAARPAMYPGDDDPTGMREKMKTELHDHPRLAHAIVSLHEVKMHLEKAPHDFGGHKAAAIKATDEAIKQLKEALKYDAQNDDKSGVKDPGKDGGSGDAKDRREQRRERRQDKK